MQFNKIVGSRPQVIYFFKKIDFLIDLYLIQNYLVHID